MITSQSGNFRILAAGGLLGLQQACTIEGSTVPMFPGSNFHDVPWGEIYVGVKDEFFCKDLPLWPTCQPVIPVDDLPTLCNASFTANILPTSSIKSSCRVQCPEVLYKATGLRRLDETATTSTCTSSSTVIKGDFR